MKGLEGLWSVGEDGVKEGNGRSAEIGKRYEKAKYKVGIAELGKWGINAIFQFATEEQSK